MDPMGAWVRLKADATRVRLRAGTTLAGLLARKMRRVSDDVDRQRHHHPGDGHQSAEIKEPPRPERAETDMRIAKQRDGPDREQDA